MADCDKPLMADLGNINSGLAVSVEETKKAWEQRLQLLDVLIKSARRFLVVTKLLFVMLVLVLLSGAFVFCVKREDHLLDELAIMSTKKAGRKLAPRLPLYKNANQPVNIRTIDLLACMTLDKKIGQMTQIERSITDNAILTKYKIDMRLPIVGSKCS